MAKSDPAGTSIEMMVEVAKLYYELNRSQEEIAQRLGKSRPTISRMLAAAREQGIVRIEIRAPSIRAEPLEHELIRKFGLKDVRVLLAGREETRLLDVLGQAGGQYISSILRHGELVGVSYGRTLASIATHLEPRPSLHVAVVQIVGAISSNNSSVDGPEIVRRFGQAYNADCHYLHLPILVQDAELKETLFRDPNISATLAMGASADVVVVGVGTLDRKNRSPIFDGLMTSVDYLRLQRQGAVGHICGEYYGLDGSRLDIDLNRRAISIGLAALRLVPTVVAVAGGASKAEAIVAGIRGGYLNVLITDNWTAERMLGLNAISEVKPTEG